MAPAGDPERFQPAGLRAQEAALLALQFTDGIGGLAPGPSLPLALALLPLLAAPVVLAVWLGRQEEGAAGAGEAMAAPGAGG